MYRVIGAVVLGVSGCAALLWLGFWQVDRLAWKEGVLANIEARIAADPVPLPAAPNPDADLYLPVAASGTIGEGTIRVLVSVKDVGAGCRIIQPFETEGRRVLLDRGFVRSQFCKDSFEGGALNVAGNLLWPDEIDSYTPAPEADWRGGGLWFARDLPAMAEALGTEPLLIVARSDTGAQISPHPVSITGIPNDHLSYAVTWFSLAAVWAGMTLLLLWRISRRTA
jgi:surfeit locus 1 family protein